MWVRSCSPAIGVVMAALLLATGCEDPPPPPGMGAFILGVRTVLPPESERVLDGGLREDL